MTEAKQLQPGVKEFTANGKKYFISERISIARYKEYEKLVPKLTFGLNFPEIFAQLGNAYSHLNKRDLEPIDAGIIIHNVMSGIKEIDNPKRINPALMMSALFILREDEDAGTYDEILMQEKIADWLAEGFEMRFFLAFALSSIHGLGETLIKYTQESLLILKTEIEKPI